MRVIYSYINFNDVSSIGTDYLFPGILSAFKSVELYGNATLYTTKNNIDRLKKFNLPFTDYIELELPQNNDITPTYSKLLTYSRQKESFIHTDLDVILNSKVNLEVSESTPIKFSHRDYPHPVDFGFMEGLYEGYLTPGYKFGLKYGFDKFTDLKLNEIPNMGIISCSDYEAFTNAAKKTLEFYEDNKEYFNSGYLPAICYLEQGLTHMYLKQFSQAYRDSVDRGDNIIYPIDNILNVYREEFSIKVPEPLSSNELYFENEKDLLENFDLDKYDSYHLLGGSKASPLSQSLIIHRLLNYMNIDEINVLEKEFDIKERNFFANYIKFIN